MEKTTINYYILYLMLINFYVFGKLVLKKLKISITIIPKHLKFTEKNQLWTYKHKQKSKLLHLEL